MGQRATQQKSVAEHLEKQDGGSRGRINGRATGWDAADGGVQEGDGWYGDGCMG